MASGAHQVIELIRSFEAVYEQTYQNLTPAEREQVARYRTCTNADARTSPPTQPHGASVSSKRPASTAMFGDRASGPKRTGHVCTLAVVPSSASVDGPEQGSVGSFSLSISCSRATLLGTGRTVYFTAPPRSTFCPNFSSSDYVSDDWTDAHSATQEWAITSARGRLLSYAVYWIQPPLHRGDPGYASGRLLSQVSGRLCPTDHLVDACHPHGAW